MNTKEAVRWRTSTEPFRPSRCRKRAKHQKQKTQEANTTRNKTKETKKKHKTDHSGIVRFTAK